MNPLFLSGGYTLLRFHIVSDANSHFSSYTSEKDSLNIRFIRCFIITMNYFTLTYITLAIFRNWLTVHLGCFGCLCNQSGTLSQSLFSNCQQTLTLDFGPRSTSSMYIPSRIRLKPCGTSLATLRIFFFPLILCTISNMFLPVVFRLAPSLVSQNLQKYGYRAHSNHSVHQSLFTEMFVHVPGDGKKTARDGQTTLMISHTGARMLYWDWEAGEALTPAAQWLATHALPYRSLARFM